MPAYIAVDIDIHDPATYERYKLLAPPAIAAYGGRYLARGGETRVLEGDWRPSRFVLLEFPSMEQAELWWGSAEYADAKALRQQSSTTQMLLVSGV